MLTRFLGEKIIYRVLLTCFIAICIALPFNKVILSISTLLSFLIVILDFNSKKYLEIFKSNRIIQVFLLFILIHLLSFFWSENVDFFLKDLNSKLPLYALPLVLVFKPIERRTDFLLLLALFLFSVLFFSVYNFVSYFSWRKEFHEDLRDMSQFISHIRFGLMVVFAFFLCLFWIKTRGLKYKILPILGAIWFLIYIYFSQVFSSYIVLFIGMLIFVILLFRETKQYKWAKIVFLNFIILCGIFAYLFLNQVNNVNKIPDFKSLNKKTAEGNYYYHDLKTKVFINGNHVYSNICDYELYRDWPKISTVNLKDTTTKGYQYYYILVQYMSSKNLKKDAFGLKSLTNSDIQNIEKGKVNYKVESVGFEKRLNTILDEFSTEDPNGKTLMQRVEYVKTGLKIFSKNVILGIGSGDLQDEFDQQYIKDKSLLKPENRLRTHNQILTYFISFGVLGGVIFLLIIYLGFVQFYKQKQHFAFLFLLIVFISFFSEDTLETQMGATFFAFFFGLFVSNIKQNLVSNSHEN